MITVQADTNKVLQPKERAEAMTVLDGNDSAFAYMVDALAAISAIVVHAENKYGPLTTDVIINALAGNTLRDKINKERRRENEDQTNDCPGC